MSDRFDTNELKASYGIGRQMGEQLLANPFDGLDLDAILEGLTDAFTQQPSRVTEADLHAAFGVIHEKMQEAKKREADAMIAAGAEFLAENAKKEGVVTTESGLQYEVITSGDGDTPTAQSTVRTHYHGTLLDGTVFDSSYNRGQPAEFPVGGVIRGWTEALQLMNVGSKWRLYVPSELAYGERGAGAAIGPHTTLIFDVELLDIVA